MSKSESVLVIGSSCSGKSSVIKLLGGKEIALDNEEN
jgi:hypothetical protein